MLKKTALFLKGGFPNCIRNLQTLKIIFSSTIAIYPLYAKFIKHEKKRCLGVNKNNKSSNLTSENKAKRTRDPGLNSNSNSKYQHQQLNSTFKIIDVTLLYMWVLEHIVLDRLSWGTKETIEMKRRKNKEWGS